MLSMFCCLLALQNEKNPNTTIVGFREHIFTGSVSSLANYMALQELSFVTLGQRVLNTPLRIRMHYGHPDLFDKVCSFYIAHDVR
jgi:callose synthase